MKRILLTFIFAAALTTPVHAQSFGDFMKSIFGNSGSKKTEETSKSADNKTSGIAAALTQSDAEKALKEALVIGAKTVGTQLSAENGYFGDKKIKIPLPGQIGKLQKNLAKVGFSGPLDDLQLRVNRAAEAAAPEAANLVVDAVRNITMEDAISLVKGGETSATDFLRLKTETKLEALLRPRLETALEDAGALKVVDDIASKYDLSQYNMDPRKDIVDHSVDKALEGLFFYLAKEEKEIRSNPVKRTSDILRKVFGG